MSVGLVVFFLYFYSVVHDIGLLTLDSGVSEFGHFGGLFRCRDWR